MPIFNPQQAFLFAQITSSSNNYTSRCFSKLLSIASENSANRDRRMAEAHQQLIKLLQRTKSLLNQKKMPQNFFQWLDFNKLKFNESAEENIYQQLLKHFANNQESSQSKTPQPDKLYTISTCGDLPNCLFKDKSDEEKDLIISKNDAIYQSHDIQCVMLCCLSYVSIFISEHNLGVFVFKNQSHDYSPLECKFPLEFFSLIFTAARFPHVFIIDDSSTNDNETLSQFLVDELVNPTHFSEIYIFSNVYRKAGGQVISEEKFHNLERKLNSTYVYAYVFFRYETMKLKESLKSFFHYQVFSFSFDLTRIFGWTKPSYRDIDHSEIDSVIFSLKSEIRINLCNIPVYDTSIREDNWSAKQLSGVTTALIKKDKLFRWNTDRVQVTLSNSQDEIDFYVDYNDLHYMNPEFYIQDPLYMAKNLTVVEEINQVHQEYRNPTKTLQKVYIKNEDSSKNMREKMHFAFHYQWKYSNNTINPYSNQIFAVYQACDYLNQNVFKSRPESKGCILQINTGEGKSYIVQALAQYLAREGKTVHIATSNIILAARDFGKSYHYFVKTAKKAKFGLKDPKIDVFPSILLHKDERDDHLHEFLHKDEMYNTQESLYSKESRITDDEKRVFYSDDAFNNPTNMNLSVCREREKKSDQPITSNVVYSTFLNFEAFYLSEMERNPGMIDKYYENAILIIDEADSLLIDELTNGTILSKPMKSNGIEILEWVYHEYKHKGNSNAALITEEIKRMHPECTDLKVDDVKRMFADIDTISNEDFCLGKKYIIAKINNEKRIVPIDLEHKGIPEPNKEFSGFIHQFIGIKEKLKPENQDLVIQPISMNYMFISHPIYVNLYKGVIGVTGTLGNENSIKIFKDHYRLDTIEVPRHRMNLRTDFPMILCNTTEERNNYICQEIVYCHRLEYPVLVVFKSLDDIDKLRCDLINTHKIDKSQISVFKGTDKSENDRSQIEENSGKPGSITIGTNFCGRGISIKCTSKPLHVIVAYYSDDKRAMNQVIGRAGRNGYPGSSRIICLKQEKYCPSSENDEQSTKELLSDFKIKKDKQAEFIQDLKDSYPWVFHDKKTKEKLKPEQIQDLNQYNINVNRKAAYQFKFPLCMNYKTFLELQAQRIYSIKNCPECKHTWNLFRRYIREMIFESWSIFLNDFDNASKDSTDYQKCLNAKYKDYIKELEVYLPRNGVKDVIDAFMHIHNIVGQRYLDHYLKLWKGKQRSINPNNSSVTFFRLGQFPLEIQEYSGMKISPKTFLDKSDSSTYKYIIDPELQYLSTDKNKKEKWFSITKIIDKLFGGFVHCIDHLLMSICGLRFFLRRTLRGCEFGVYLPTVEATSKPPNLLFDTEIIMMLSITTKSTTFWLAGILIVLLIFLSGLAICLVKFNPETLVPSIAKMGAKLLFTWFLGKSEESFTPGKILLPFIALLDKIISYLGKKVHDNFEKSKKKRPSDDDLFDYSALLDLFMGIDTDTLDEKLEDKVYSKIKLDPTIKNHLKACSPIGKMIKIGILLIILMAQYLNDFKNWRRRRINLDGFTKKQAKQYKKEDSQNEYIDDIYKYQCISSTAEEISDVLNEYEIRDVNVKNLDYENQSS